MQSTFREFGGILPTHPVVPRKSRQNMVVTSDATSMLPPGLQFFGTSYRVRSLPGLVRDSALQVINVALHGGMSIPIMREALASQVTPWTFEAMKRRFLRTTVSTTVRAAIQSCFDDVALRNVLEHRSLYTDDLLFMGQELGFYPIVLYSGDVRPETTTTSLTSPPAPTSTVSRFKEQRLLVTFRHGQIPGILFLYDGVRYTLVEHLATDAIWSGVVYHSELDPTVRMFIESNQTPAQDRQGEVQETVDAGTGTKRGRLQWKPSSASVMVVADEDTDVDEGTEEKTSVIDPETMMRLGRVPLVHSSHGVRDVGPLVVNELDRRIHIRTNRYMDRANKVTVPILKALAKQYGMSADVYKGAPKAVLSHMVATYESRHDLHAFDETVETYPIRDIIGYRVGRNGKEDEFLVVWEGYVGKDSWEPASGLPDEITTAFLTKQVI